MHQIPVSEKATWALVVAYMNGQKVAVKMRRIDADRLILIMRPKC
jgi:hypothetical protein